MSPPLSGSFHSGIQNRFSHTQLPNYSWVKTGTGRQTNKSKWEKQNALLQEQYFLTVRFCVNCRHFSWSPSRVLTPAFCCRGICGAGGSAWPLSHHHDAGLWHVLGILLGDKDLDSEITWLISLDLSELPLLRKMVYFWNRTLRVIFWQYWLYFNPWAQMEDTKS